MRRKYTRVITVILMIVAGMTMGSLVGCTTVKTVYDLQRCGGSGNCGSI